jgi:hypothetical protein
MRFVLLASLAAVGCASAGHTLAYRKASTAKSKAATLLAKADGPYVQYASDLDELIADVDEGYTQAHSHSDDRASKQWLVVKDELRQFAADWQHIGALSGPYVHERRQIILGDLDAIISDEANKRAD